MQKPEPLIPRDLLKHASLEQGFKSLPGGRIQNSGEQDESTSPKLQERILRPRFERSPCRKEERWEGMVMWATHIPELSHVTERYVGCAVTQRRSQVHLHRVSCICLLGRLVPPVPPPPFSLCGHGEVQKRAWSPSNLATVDESETYSS